MRIPSEAIAVRTAGLTTADGPTNIEHLFELSIRVTTMPSESQSKYDQKLVHVLKTSAGVFADKGYHSTSMRDISRATKMSLSGLYYYFKSKEELLFLIQDYCFSTVIDECNRLLAGVDDPAKRLKLVIENHLNYFVHNTSEMKVLSHEANSIGGDFHKKISSKKRQYVDLVIELLDELAREAGVHPVHLSRVFRRCVGEGIGEYVHRLRVRTACERMLAPHNSLSELSLGTGFADQSHFTRAFRKITGLTPATFRSALLRAS